MFEHCLETGTDFYEMGSGNLFHISDYVESIKNGEAPEGIMVSDGLGTYTGIVLTSKVNDIIRTNNLHPRWMEKKEN